VLADGFLGKSGGNVGVGLGKRELHAISHIEILRQKSRLDSQFPGLFALGT
jgi:hypothetical protein